MEKTHHLNRQRYIGIVFVASLFLLLIARKILSKGMFLDGLIYATIARNLSQGTDWWHLYVAPSWMGDFRSHPPLAFWLQSLFFDLFGDHIWVEKIYSATTVIVAAILTMTIWVQCRGKRHTQWLPVVLMLLVPQITLSITDNLLENTMMVFVLSSVSCLLQSRKSRPLLWVFLAGLSLFAAFMTKGFTGLYPLCMPLIYGCIMREGTIAKAVRDTLLLTLTVIISFGLMLIVSDEAASYFLSYLSNTVQTGIAEEQTVGNRFYILKYFFEDSAIVLSVVAAMLVLTRLLGRREQTEARAEHLFTNRYTTVLLLLVAAGTLPIMITLKQRGFYLMTVYPLLCVALGLLIEHPIESVMERWRRWLPGTAVVVTIVMLAGAVVLLVENKGKIVREKEMIGDIEAILTVVPNNTTVSILPSTDNSFIAYIYRVAYVDCDMSTDHHTYLIATEGDLAPVAEQYTEYHQIPLNTKTYRLYTSAQEKRQ